MRKLMHYTNKQESEGTERETKIISSITHQATDITIEVRNADEMTEQELIDLREEIKNELQRVTANDIDEITPTDAIQHDIILTDYKPIRQRIRKSPINKRAELKALLDKMLQARLISHSKSDWLSPINIVIKKVWID